MPDFALGNHDAVHHATRQPIPGEQVTSGHIPDDWPLQDQFRTVTHQDGTTAGIWATHAADDARPAWVWSSSAELAELLAAHYGCPIAEPTDDTSEG
jgi:hypothetical protein